MGKINTIYSSFTKKYSNLIYRSDFADYEDFKETLFEDLKEELEYNELSDKFEILQKIILDYLEEFAKDKYNNDLSTIIGNIYYCPECKESIYSMYEIFECKNCEGTFI